MPLDVDYTAGSAYHVARRKFAPHSRRCLQVAFDLLGTPASLLDVGCGQEAPQVTYARARGVDAMGVDLAVPDADGLVRADLRERIDLGRQFQWVLCWEVAEHLPELAAGRLVRMLVRHMMPNGRILFTAASPGQAGPGHLTLQPPEWWMAQFGVLGLTYADDVTAQVRRAWRLAAPRAPWYGQNLQVYWRPA